MISGKQLLPLLIGAALGAGGWMQGLDKSPSGNDSRSDDLEEQLRIARDETAMLAKENESLRSLAQGGGEVSVPPEMIAKVEKDYGLTFLANPVFHRIAGEELGYRIEAAIESRMGPQGVDDREEAYKRLGWLEERDKFLEQLVAVRSVGKAGWFDQGVGEAWVTDRFDLKNVPDQAIMLRLLVRILLEQHFPAPAAYPGDDAARAREALHDGAASGAEARHYAMSANTIGFTPLNQNGAAARLHLALPEFISGITSFPEIEGKALAEKLFVKGAEKFADALRNAPQDTLGIVQTAAKSPAREWASDGVSDEIYLRESAGYLGLRLWISKTEDTDQAEKIARQWAGDGFVLFADGSSSTGLVWEVEFISRETADQFERVALRRIGAMVGSDRAIKGGEILESGERFLAFARVSETVVKFLNVVERETAMRIIGKP